MHPGVRIAVIVAGALAIAPGAHAADPGSERQAPVDAVVGPPIPSGPAVTGGDIAAEASGEPAPTEDAGIAVAPETERRPLGAAPSEERAAASGVAGDTFAGNWVGRTVLALAFVIGLAVLLRALMRRAASGSGLVNQLGAGGRAPSGLLSVLGRYPVARGQTLVLLKVDRRVLLLSQTSAGFSTLSEITDPEEVASILVTTRDEEGESMAARFSTVLQDLERDPRIAGVEQAPTAWGPTTPRTRAQRDTAEHAGDPVAQLRRRLASMSEPAE